MELKDKDLQGIVTRVLTHGAAREVMANEIIELARILDDERAGRRAMDEVNKKRAARLDGEIAERSQRQLEITGRLAALERDLANARADAQAHHSARKALEQWEAEVRTALGVGPTEDRRWMVREIARLKSDVANYRQRWETQAETVTRARGAHRDQLSKNAIQDSRIRDLEAQANALHHAIADVWALVAHPDGYGSPFYSEPGLDDTTPAEAVERVLGHLRRAVSSGSQEHLKPYVSKLKVLQIGQLNPANAEAMAALNAADRQSDDDQICGC